MRAVVINGFGGAETTRLADVPPPEVGPGQVLIRIVAAGVNPVDWKIREGYLKEVIPFTFPTILGNEVAGTIEAVGAGVTRFAIGDAVHTATGMIGGFAELVAVDAELVAAKPSNISFTEAAALPVAAATAMTALDAGGVGQGSRVLIHAASGGVGSIALQLARARGAEVTALASAENLDFVRDLGASIVVDRTSDYEQTIGDFDMVLDAFGPAAQARSWSLLRKGGILVSLVAPPSEEVAKTHDVRATMIYGVPNGTTLAAVDVLVQAGEVKITVARTYPLDDVVAALAEVQRGQVRGKLVLTI